MSAAIVSPLAGSSPITLSEVPTRIRARMVSGREAVASLQNTLEALCVRCGQRGGMDHLAYFLDWESSRKKVPHLVLLEGPSADRMGGPDELQGALLIHEYQMLGVGTRVFSTDDTTGRRTLIARAADRTRFARLAAETLLKHGALVVMQTVLDPPRDSVGEAGGRLARSWRVATRRRQIPSYLPLASTFDGTLAGMGQKTRRNLRYYRRGAEAQFGCHFVADVQISRSGLQTFNRECTYAVTDELAGWRYDALGKVPGMFLSGIRDRDGRWLSITGARVFHDMVEVDWQMNRDGMAASSLGTVMRAYLIEHLVGLGVKRLYLEGGTPHPMRFSFMPEIVQDVAVVRHGWIVRLMRSGLGRRVPANTFVFQVLSDPALGWRSFDADAGEQT